MLDMWRNLIRGAAEGMQYLHSEDIIHGNFKCANVLVTTSREACISDFGLARLLDEMIGSTASPASTLAQSSGSLRWMAPEILDGSEGVSKESDTYSFGMAVLELLTRKRPFHEYRSDIAVIRARSMRAQPERPIGHVEWLGDGMWALMQRCWSWEPSSRPTMEVVVMELKEM